VSSFPSKKLIKLKDLRNSESWYIDCFHLALAVRDITQNTKGNPGATVEQNPSDPSAMAGFLNQTEIPGPADCRHHGLFLAIQIQSCSGEDMKNDRGFALVLSLIILLMVTLLTVGAMNTSVRTTSFPRRHFTSLKPGGMNSLQGSKQVRSRIPLPQTRIGRSFLRQTSNGPKG
jgi:hypothetical protein